MYATYNITNDRLKLFTDGERLSDEDYQAGRKLSLAWWHGSKCLTGIWTPSREDFILRFVDEILEDDSPDDLEGRVERYSKYAQNDEDSASYAQERAIKANTSRQQQQAEATALKKLDEARYWNQRIAGAIRNAQYKDKPDVIVRRIKKLEAEQRKQEKTKKQSELMLKLYKEPDKAVRDRETKEPAPFKVVIRYLLNRDPIYSLDDCSLMKLDEGTQTPEYIQETRINSHQEIVNRCDRWLNHLAKRIEYETEYLKAVGGSEESLKPKPRRKSIASDDGLEKGQIIYAGYGGRGYLRAKILTLSAKSARVEFLDFPDIAKHYPKGYKAGRRFIKKELPK